jgi:hypothetical protein
MPTFGVVEALDVVEHICPGIVAGPTNFAATPSVFRDEQKLYVAALFQALPSRLMLQLTP